MNVCKYIGNRHRGSLLCGQPMIEAESITTDDRVVTCQECLLKLRYKTHNNTNHIHLNADFLSHVSLGETGLIDFDDYEHQPDGRRKLGIKNYKVVCKQDEPDFFVPASRMTNDPKKVSCSHCLKTWGRKETMLFVLQGVMMESGIDMKTIRFKLQGASKEKLKRMLDKMLYGDKV